MRKDLVVSSVLAVLGCGCQVHNALKESVPVSASVGIQDQRTERIAKAICATMRKEGIPGLSIAIIDGGQLVWAQGFGWRDVKNRLPVDTDTQFQVGSISKPVTALGVLLLEADGQVDLDADVNRYLKDWHLDSKYPDQPVTLRLLLHHRSGMVPQGFLGCSESKRTPTLLEALNRGESGVGVGLVNLVLGHNTLGQIQVTDPPGSVFRYSGGGYCVVQKVMEDVTGEPFEEIMNRIELEPLQMSRSHFRQPPMEEETGNMAHGYSWKKTVAYGGRWGVFPQKAAAGLWTTPQDLARWIIAVQKARSGVSTGPISPAIAEEFLNPRFDGGMGTGIFLDGEGENRGFFHGGETLGYGARFGAGVFKGRGWVIMTNAEKDRCTPILKAVVEEFGWIDPKKEAGKS
jgi:CubicO group peptidase (beta-lactamase class C family)